MSAEDDILAQELATLAFCWRLERRDGVTLGLTSHDRDIAVDGVIYRAAPGMVPSAIRLSGALEADGMDIEGGLSSRAIRAADLASGRWDGAALRIMLTEWSAPGVLWLELARGTIGAVERTGDGFTAELTGPAAMLDMPVAPETSPDCRAVLGDRRCRVDLSGRRRLMRVAAVDGAQVSVTGGGLAADAYAFGSLRWLSGANCGLSQAILSSGTAGVTLTDPPAFIPSVGTRVLLTEGCDKRMDSCAGRFGNAANFQGEPYLPGNDLLTRYPGA
jgi:uncharacterized phage protein (TIGR02218 family)